MSNDIKQSQVSHGILKINIRRLTCFKNNEAVYPASISWEIFMGMWKNVHKGNRIGKRNVKDYWSSLLKMSCAWQTRGSTNK